MWGAVHSYVQYRLACCQMWYDGRSAGTCRYFYLCCFCVVDRSDAGSYETQNRVFNRSKDGTSSVEIVDWTAVGKLAFFLFHTVNRHTQAICSNGGRYTPTAQDENKNSWTSVASGHVQVTPEAGDSTSVAPCRISMIDQLWSQLVPSGTAPFLPVRIRFMREVFTPVTWHWHFRICVCYFTSVAEGRGCYTWPRQWGRGAGRRRRGWEGTDIDI